MRRSRLFVLCGIIIVFAVAVAWLLSAGNNSVPAVTISQPQASATVPTITPTTPPTTTPTQASSTAGIKTYANAEYGFEFQYPAAWIFDANCFSSPSSKFNLISNSHGGGRCADFFVPDFEINVVTQDFANAQFIDNPNLNATTSKVVVAGVEGQRFEYYWKQLSEITAILPLGHYEILLTSNKLGDNEAIFNQILASFKFLKPSQ